MDITFDKYSLYNQIFIEYILPDSVIAIEKKAICDIMHCEDNIDIKRKVNVIHNTIFIGHMFNYCT